MASYENNDVDLVEIDLEAIEIDGALLREILGDQEDKGNECVVEESLVEETNKVNPNMMNMKQEREKEKNCLEPNEGQISNDLEWLNVIDMMMVEPTTNNNPLGDAIMNWFNLDYDDIVGMVDFGYANGECNYTQVMCDGFVSNNEVSYGGLWENYGIN